VQCEVTAGFPVESVSWEQAAEFCRRLSDLKEERDAGRRYRLPTEAEWEYACRAGTATAYSSGDQLGPEHANFDSDDTLRRPRSCGTYEPNALGLYDMHGNVWEWCQDWYGENYYASSPRTDPRGPEAGKTRVVRGGSWERKSAACRSAFRFNFVPQVRRSEIGFRVLCEVAE
jgi:formylglycine-generating enzyme required for sulfatase activity